MIKAVIFDMGGVILRTMDPTKREAMAKRLGVTRSELEEVVFQSETSVQSELGQLSEAGHWRAVLAYFKQPLDCYQDWYGEFFSGDAIDQKLITFIGTLKPRVKVGLLSNAWEHARQNLSSRFDFINIFDVTIFSYEVGLRKPDPRIFDLILRQMGIEAGEAIFVDDFRANIDSAAALGLKTVWYQDRESAINKITRFLNM
jgi:epoxide hydrolase-like predicted phosphatase